MRVSFITIFGLLIFTSSCDLFPGSEKSNSMVELFTYTENNYTWGVNLIELQNGTGGYCLLTEEYYTPTAYSLVKLNNEFEIVWKQTFDHEYFTDVLELPNGDILLSGGPSLVLVKADGKSYSRPETNKSSFIHGLVLEDESIILYGSNFEYKPFFAKYNMAFEKIWERRDGYYTTMTSDFENNIYGMSTFYDSIRIYNTDGDLLSEIAVKGISDFSAKSFKLDNNGNYIVLGVSNYTACCCNNDISLYKISSEGNILWNKRLGNSNANDYSSGLIIDEDFYAVCGASGETNCLGAGLDGNYYNMYAAKISLNGSLIKEYSMGGKTTEDGLSSIVKSNGKYIVAGGLGNTSLSPKAVIYSLRDF